MTAVSFLIPRHNYTYHDEYDLLDAILCSSGFVDYGVVTLGDYSFREYSIAAETIMRWSFVSGNPIKDGNIQRKLAFYTQIIPENPVLVKLDDLGVMYVCPSAVGKDVILYQFCIDRCNLPRFASVCSDLKPSKHMVEEISYNHWSESGYRHGNDLEDWFGSEWEASRRISDIIRRFNDEVRNNASTEWDSGAGGR